MAKLWNPYGKRCAASIFAALLALALCAPAMAAEGSARVLKVAFPQTKGLTETAEDGTRYGLMVDYLNEIAKYTGWEYEYIDTTGEDMVEEFTEGKYDLMGGTYYLPGFEDYFAYPDYNTGYSRSALLARRDDHSVQSSNYESLNGKTIGVYANAKENIRRLKEFLSINNLDCTLKEYVYSQLSEDGNLYAYLESGEVDLLLGNVAEDNAVFRVALSYNSQPYYIVTNVGNQEVLDGLNMALERIVESNPNFSTERYAANFPSQIQDIQLNDGELEYIHQKGSVTVAVPEHWHPLFCMTTEGDMHNGLVPDLMEQVREFSGLEYSYVYAETYLDAVEMVERGEADVLGFFLGTEEDAARQGLALSSAYTELDNIIVRNKSSSYPAQGLTCAVIEGRTLPGDIIAQSFPFANITDALSAVNQGKIDFVYGLSPRLEQEIQQYHFNNLVPVSLVNDTSSICFALTRPANPNLLTILNKSINRLTSEEKDSMLNRNLVSIGANQFSIAELVYADPVLFVVILAVILLIVVVAVLIVARARMRAAVMQSNLERAQAESRAKGEFLSRMSHEIRTPMNAVVGLADLTGMLEGVPENVRENLAKIRASSQYLLSLINDILDMSRIENGMLSIANEPFSLEQMVDNLYSMMEAEAQRRGVDFSVKQEIRHSDLMGDAVRLRQVLTNLLSNAFKFTPEGGRVVLRVTEEADATFTFRVIDSGVGIRPEDQKRIFGSFEQLGTSSSKSQGTGLGLAISSNIVKLMGGELSVRSELGTGSEFYFTITFPLGKAEDRMEKLTASGLLKGAMILLAEDNDLNAEIATQLLEIQGASVCRSENGALALERFRRSAVGEFQVILMDIQMPEMNGLEAARAIRKLDRPDAATVPIVAMTANSFKEDADAAREAGMTGFIPKPLDVGYLYHVLQEILNQADREKGQGS